MINFPQDKGIVETGNTCFSYTSGICRTIHQFMMLEWFVVNKISNTNQEDECTSCICETNSDQNDCKSLKKSDTKLLKTLKLRNSLQYERQRCIDHQNKSIPMWIS